MTNRPRQYRPDYEIEGPHRPDNPDAQDWFFAFIVVGLALYLLYTILL